MVVTLERLKVLDVEFVEKPLSQPVFLRQHPTFHRLDSSAPGQPPLDEKLSCHAFHHGHDNIALHYVHGSHALDWSAVEDLHSTRFHSHTILSFPKHPLCCFASQFLQMELYLLTP